MALAAWVALIVCVAAVVSGQTGDTPAEREARVREQLAAAERLYLEGKAAAALDAEDPTILEDLVKAAWQDAHDQVAELQAATNPLGGLGLDPGGLGGLLGGGG